MLVIGSAVQMYLIAALPTALTKAMYGRAPVGIRLINSGIARITKMNETALSQNSFEWTKAFPDICLFLPSLVVSFLYFTTDFVV